MTNGRLGDELLALECELLDTGVRHSPEHLDVLLADDFIEFGASGRIFDKASVIRSLLESAGGVDYRVRDFRLLAAGDSQALAVYCCEARDVDGHLLRTSNRSSFWIHRDGRWQMAFHQGTLSS